MKCGSECRTAVQAWPLVKPLHVGWTETPQQGCFVGRARGKMHLSAAGAASRGLADNEQAAQQQQSSPATHYI
jgi:hypothetical protein